MQRWTTVTIAGGSERRSLGSGGGRVSHWSTSPSEAALPSGCSPVSISKSTIPNV